VSETALSAIIASLVIGLMAGLTSGCSVAPSARGTAGGDGAGTATQTLADVRVATATAALPGRPMALRLIGAITIDRVPSDPLLQHLGGISGLDYDAATDTWFLLSDDRSEESPARFYTARLNWSEHGMTGVLVLGVTTLLQKSGAPYPNARVEIGAGDPQPEIPDPEAMRLDSRTGQLLWSSEGDRKRGIQPFMRWTERDGRFVRELPLPARLEVHPREQRGARDNLSLEGLAFAADGSVWAAMESPLIEDGEPPSPKAGALTRFTHLDREGRLLGQYAYPLDAVPVPPTGGHYLSDNGVSELLVTPAGTLLVLERSGREVADRDFKFHIRLYEASVDGATDIKDVDSLLRARVAPMRKRLVLDLQSAGVDAPIDNLEGMAWGPIRTNGRRTLVMISDDNFSRHQVTQVLAFEVD
jgi:hypothetical protein